MADGNAFLNIEWLVKVGMNDAAVLEVHATP
jgi:hypothetical protein